MISITRRGPRTDGRKTQARRKNQTILKNFLLPHFFLLVFLKEVRSDRLIVYIFTFPVAKCQTTGCCVQFRACSKSILQRERERGEIAIR